MADTLPDIPAAGPFNLPGRFAILASSMVPQSYYRCWVEVDLDALRHNVAAIRRRLRPGTKLMAVVKADAYGHGLPQVARGLMECGVDAFAVANLSEALALRHLGGSGWPILLFGSALQFEVAKMVEQQITPTISTLEEAGWFEAEAVAQDKQVAVQVEVDTGMGRVGIWHQEAAAQIHKIMALPHLRVAGVFTHFPSADENVEETRRELALFHAVIHQLAADQQPVPLWHAANSAALLNVPEAHLDIVRPGLLLYGICPDGCTAPDVRPVLSFKARVAYVKSIAPGRTISYGQTFVADKPMRVATIAAGYGDGFNRHLSNQTQVLIGGQRCALLGRVTMDQIMVDVTHLPQVQGGDEVVFIGCQGAEIIAATEVARWAETIPWDVLCGITKSARVPRIYRGLSAA
jgi:alanine racemase